MVNASIEGLDMEVTSLITSFSPSEEIANCSIKGECSNFSRETPEEASNNGESCSAPSPQSPVGSESWQCSGSSAILMKIDDLISQGASLKDVLKTVCPSLREPPHGWSDDTVMSILSEIIDQPPRRGKLTQYNTFEDAIELFRTKKRILILTGAGVSVSCGIPDFRSKDGIYARLHVDFPDLPDPTAMFDIRYFVKNPAPFYDFAKEIFPGQFEPSVAHKFIYQLEKSDKLLRNYTQNIDTLENQTGIKRVIECHGSFSKASCLACRAHFDGDIIKEDVMAKRVSMCPECKVGVIKPDIVFFGEDLSQDFHRQMAVDKNDVDLLVVIGSSLKVRPVSLIPFSVSPDVPQILINREPIPSYTADIELLGDCDEIIRDICLALGGCFDEMLVNHDAKMKILKESEGPVVSTSTMEENLRKRRSVVPHDQFLEMMSSLDKKDEQPEVEEEKVETEGEKKKETTEDEPVAKKMRLEDMYQRNFVSLAQQLPGHAYFQLNPNRAVFSGAELYYDLNSKMIARPVHQYRKMSVSSSDDDSSTMDEFDPYNGTGKGGSEPPSNMTCRSSPPPTSRPPSCEPSFDLDAFLSPAEIKAYLDEAEYNLPSSDDFSL